MAAAHGASGTKFACSVTIVKIQPGKQSIKGNNLMEAVYTGNKKTEKSDMTRAELMSESVIKD